MLHWSYIEITFCYNLSHWDYILLNFLTICYIATTFCEVCLRLLYFLTVFTLRLHLVTFFIFYGNLLHWGSILFHFVTYCYTEAPSCYIVAMFLKQFVALRLHFIKFYYIIVTFCYNLLHWGYILLQCGYILNSGYWTRLMPSDSLNFFSESLLFSEL